MCSEHNYKDNFNRINIWPPKVANWKYKFWCAFKKYSVSLLHCHASHFDTWISYCQQMLIINWWEEHIFLDYPKIFQNHILKFQLSRTKFERILVFYSDLSENISFKPQFLEHTFIAKLSPRDAMFSDFLSKHACRHSFSLAISLRVAPRMLISSRWAILCLVKLSKYVIIREFLNEDNLSSSNRSEYFSK